MKTTFALFFGNRGFFPETLIAAAREETEAALHKIGIDTIALPPEATRFGAVETAAEGRVYADFLKRNGELQENLRGFALYKSVSTPQYKLFESNICDSKSGALVAYGVATFSNGLTCYVSIDLSRICERYTLHYDAFYKNKSMGSATGTIDGELTVSFDETTGIDESKVASHMKIAQSVVNNLIEYTASLIEASGLDITIGDFALTVK